MSVVERGSSALTGVPMSCPPWKGGGADRHRAGFRGLVILVCGEVSLTFILAGSNLKSIGWIQENVSCNQKIRIQILPCVQGISSELFIHSFRHS